MTGLQQMLVRATLALGAAGAIATSTAALAQATASPHTYATRYDAMGRVTGTIAPDPDGGGPLKHPATRTIYDQRGNPVKVEIGELQTWKSHTIAPVDWGTDFDIHTFAETTFDLRNRKLTERLSGKSGGTVTAVSLVQYSYDAAGRLECTVVRMNPAVYGSLPASACTMGVEGSNGPDRITRTSYNSAGQVLQVKKAVGTPIEIADVTYSYTLNGKIKQVVDANGNRAELRYDGHDRQSRWVFPSKTQPSAFDDTNAMATAGALNESDYEEYTYDANGNRLTQRKRDGSVLAFTYDNLNRITKKTVPERVGLAATHTRDVFYSYDLRGLQLQARFDSLAGAGVAYGYDGFGRAISETQNTDGVSRTLASQYDAN
ncbi:MAG: RHS repeat domain-containing protein, partial [Pseudomonas sp.]|nr:RHS repeat domain-containing protein [Pseudomonas sp.]